MFRVLGCDRTALHIRFGAMAEKDTGSGKKDVSGTTAPSIGPNTVIDSEPAADRLARHEQSDTDAMGQDKRREVVGGQYGASAAKQATMYGAALGIIALVVIGFILLVGQLDQAPSNAEDQAPWSDPAASQTDPEPLE